MTRNMPGPIRESIHESIKPYGFIVLLLIWRFKAFGFCDLKFSHCYFLILQPSGIYAIVLVSN